MTEQNPKPDPENQPSAEAPAEPHTPPDQKSKPRRRRRWPWVVGAIILVLAVLVLLAPTLLSMGWARALVVDQINRRINGRAQIADWSLGWFSGTRIDGLVIYDRSNRQILQLPHFQTGLSLWNAVRGHYDIGNSEIDRLDILVSREPDGTLNWSHLSKAAEPKSQSSASTSRMEKRQPTKVPYLRGELALNNCTITYEDPSSGAQPVFVRSIQGEVKIPDINQPITDSLSAQAQSGSLPPGSASLEGTMAAVKNNVVDETTPSVDQTLKLTGVENSALSGLLGPKGKLELAGRTNGQVTLRINNGADGSFQASVVSTGFGAAGSQLNGSQLKSDSLTFELPKTTLKFPKTLADTSSMQVQLGDGSAPGVLARLNNATLTNGQGAASKAVITGDTFTIDASGNYAADSSAHALALARLDIGDSQKIVSVKKSPDSDFAATLPDHGSPTAKGSIDLTADLKRLNGIARAFSPPQTQPAAGKGTESTPTEITGGTLAGTFRLTSDGDRLHLLPAMRVDDLALDGQPYPEKQIDLDGDLAYAAAGKVLDVKNLTAKAATTNALALVLQGRVDDLGGTQKIENVLTADVDYDAAALWKLILPLMSKTSQEKMASAQVAGKYHKRFEVRGAYPSGKSSAESLQRLLAQGDVQLDLFDGQGVTLKQVEVPIVLKDGVLQIAYPAGASTQPVPQPAYFNGGTLDMGGCTVDLRGPHMLLTTPKGLKLVQNATLNPIFASWWFGSVLNNPAFVSASQASGLMSIIIANCDRVPLDSSVASPNDGNATLNISIMGLHLGNPMLQQIAQATRVNLNSFQGNVKDYRVTIANGVVHQDFTMTVGEHQRPLHLAGDVRKSNNQMLGFNLDLPLKDLGLNVDKNIQGFLPDTITIPLGGSSDSPVPQVDFGKIIADATQKALKQNVLGGILPGSSTQPSDQNPVQQLEDLFGKKKKKKQKK